MAKQNKTPLAKTGGALALPDYMSDHQKSGKEGMSKHVIPNMIKQVNDNSNEEVTALFRTGDLIIRPSNVLLQAAEYPDSKARGKIEPMLPGPPIVFTPLFFFAEYIQWSDLKTRGADTPPIMQRSINPASALAKLCESRATREGMVGKTKVVNCKHLTFIVVIEHEEFTGMPFMLSFSRGEYKYGSRLLQSLTMRNGPIFGMRFEAFTDYHSSKDNKWVGIGTRPVASGEAWVDKESFEYNAEQHKNFAELHAKDLLEGVQHDSNDVPDDDKIS